MSIRINLTKSETSLYHYNVQCLKYTAKSFLNYCQTDFSFFWGGARVANFYGILWLHITCNFFSTSSIQKSYLNKNRRKVHVRNMKLKGKKCTKNNPKEVLDFILHCLLLVLCEQLLRRMVFVVLGYRLVLLQ